MALMSGYINYSLAIYWYQCILLFFDTAIIPDGWLIHFLSNLFKKSLIMINAEFKKKLTLEFKKQTCISIVDTRVVE